jgi:CRISPR type III-B/RAMP module RAMP protein Cmr6
MPQSCRDVIKNIWTDGGMPIGTNAGLLRDRYLELSVKDDKDKKALERLHKAISEAIVHSLEIYRLAYAKSYAAINISMPREEGIFKTDGRMVIGLGGENVLETGLSFQHTFGTPLIPGSALKGLAAHYCDQVWGASDSRFKLGEKYHETIFGTTEDSGHIIFHDAWIVPESLVDSLKPDVMTPHHGGYYSKKDGAAPTDFDDPNPITFLSIVGSFHVIVSCDVSNEDGERWAKFAFTLLTDALGQWGIGGKTNAGYGRLVPDNSPKSTGQPPERSDDSTTNPPDLEPQKPAKMLKYNKGDIVEVTKAADPNKKRGAPYFLADDGVGGQVTLGTAPSVEIGQKARLQIKGRMEKEGLYDFAAVGAKKEPVRPKNRGGRR